MKTNSLIVPIYRNEENIGPLLAAIEDLNRRLDGDLEVVFTIDGSPDNSGALLAAAKKGFSCRIVFHSRNFGSFVAIRTGMEHATGKYLAAMAADLQEPPELILEFFRLLATGEVDVVFGQRTARADPFFKKLFSNIFWGAYRRFVLPAMPKGGVDIFGCTRQVAKPSSPSRNPTARSSRRCSGSASGGDSSPTSGGCASTARARGTSRAASAT